MSYTSGMSLIIKQMKKNTIIVTGLTVNDNRWLTSAYKWFASGEYYAVFCESAPQMALPGNQSTPVTNFGS